MPKEPELAPPAAGAELPTVSAVIPAYNAAETIERALNSVYAQTYPNIIEVIVVDDGSTDATAQIVRDKFPQVTLIQQENAGSPTARNRGVEAASGEYIAFLDDDDEWLPEKTEVQFSLSGPLLSNGLTFADASNEARPGAVTEGDGSAELQLLTFSEAFPSLPWSQFYYGCSGWVLARSLFVRMGGFLPAMRRSQDTEFIWRLLLDDIPVAVIHRKLVRYYPRASRLDLSGRSGITESWYRCLTPVVASVARSAVEKGDLPESEGRDLIAAFHFGASCLFSDEGQRVLRKECLRNAVRFSRPLSSMGLRCRAMSIAPKGYRAASACLSVWRRLLRPLRQGHAAHESSGTEAANGAVRRHSRDG